MRPTITWEGVLLGIGLSVAGYLALPLLKPTDRSPTEQLAGGLKKIGRQTRRWLEVIKEEWEDIIVDANFEKMRRALDREITG